MNKTTMTLANADWTIGDIAETWADDETLTPEQCREAADTQIAWMTNHLHEQLPGWTYDAGAGSFHGTAPTGDKVANPVLTILSLISDAADYVIEHLDEIRAGD